VVVNRHYWELPVCCAEQWHPVSSVEQTAQSVHCWQVLPFIFFTEARNNYQQQQKQTAPSSHDDIFRRWWVCQEYRLRLPYDVYMALTTMRDLCLTGTINQPSGPELLFRDCTPNDMLTFLLTIFWVRGHRSTCDPWNPVE